MQAISLTILLRVMMPASVSRLGSIIVRSVLMRSIATQRPPTIQPPVLSRSPIMRPASKARPTNLFSLSTTAALQMRSNLSCRYEHARPISRRSHPAPLPLLLAPTLPLRLLLAWNMAGGVSAHSERDLYQYLREQGPNLAVAKPRIYGWASENDQLLP
jgi:hypothetical protein